MHTRSSFIFWRHFRNSCYAAGALVPLGFVLSALAWFAPLVNADTSTPAVELPEVVVTANRPEATDPDTINPELNTGFSTRVNRSDWISDTGNLGDVLAKAPGIQVRKTGSLGGFAVMSMRGSLSDQVAVYLDGFLLNDATGGGVNLNSIGLGELESVDVYEGASPLQGGRAAIGGAVFLSSRSESLKDRTTLSVGLGNQGSSGAGINTYSRLGNSRVSTTIDYLTGSNNFRYLNDNGTPLNHDDDATEQRINNGFRRYSLLAKIDTPLGNDQTLKASFRGYDNMQKLPSWNNLGVHTYLANQLQHIQLKLNSNAFPIWYERSSIAVDFQKQEERYDDRLGEIGLGQQDEKATTRATAVRWFADRALGTALLESNFDWRYETYDSADALHPPTTRSDRISFGAAASATLFRLDDRLMIKPTLVLQGFLGNQGAIAAPRMLWDALHTNPQIGIRYDIDPRIVLKANFSRGQRDPAIYELYGDHGFFLGNPDLVAESSLNGDIGFEFKNSLRTHEIAIQWTSAIFSQAIKDGITKTYNAQGIGKAINIGQAQILGIESTLRAAHFSYGTISYSTTWLNATNETPNSMAYGKQLPGRFRETHALSHSWGGPRFNIKSDFLFQRGLYFDSQNFFPAKNRATLDVGIKAMNAFGEITLSVQNVTNKQYQDFNGYPYADRLVLAGYKITF